MAFQINVIVDSKSDYILAKARHQNNTVLVTVRGAKDHDSLAGRSVQGEIGFDEILDWRVLEDFEDARSGIWQEPDGIHLAGRIHSILDYGDGRTIVDVYIQNGPEFFTVNLNATDEDAPDANEGLEIIVKNLFLFPRS